MLVIFDFDGTLADTWPWLAEELVANAGRLNYRQMTRAQVEELRSLDSCAMFEALELPFDRLPSVAADLRRRAEVAASGFRLFERVPYLIRTLHGFGATLAVVTSNKQSVVRIVLGDDLHALFTTLCCEVNVFDKTAAFTNIMSQTSTSAANTVVVGDETRDLQAAYLAGIRGIGVEWGYTAADAFRSSFPSQTATSVDQLLHMRRWKGEGGSL